MPLYGEHEQPLRLVCGEDQRLLWGLRAAALLAAALTFGAGLAMELKLLSALLALACLRSLRRPGAVTLVVQHTGHCAHGAVHGVLDASAWLSAHYAFVGVREHGRRRTVVISASRQRNDDYRKLLAWLRLGRWTEGSG